MYGRGDFLPRGVKNGTKREVPKWFIDQLVDEEDIEEAEKGILIPDKQVKFRCSVCGTESVTKLRNKVEMSTGREKRGCKVCSSRSSMIKRRVSREDFPKWFVDSIYLESDKIRALNKELVMSEKIYFKCSKGYIYCMKPNDRIVRTTGKENHGCYICNRYSSQRGKWEDEIDSIINCDGGFKVLKNYNGLIINDTGRHYEIDLYYPELRLGIECNGSYWHATLGKHLKYPKDKNYHHDKFMKCKEKGIRLISIFDVDYNDRLKEFLADVTRIKKKVYARNLCIRNVDLDDARDFCNRYHLLGYSIQGNIRYGLYNCEELVALMTFGKARFGGDGYELVRFVVKSGMLVVGGADRLLCRFEREVKPSKIISYSDNDYFMGEMYRRLGFVEDGQTSLDYYWWNPRTFEKFAHLLLALIYSTFF